MKIFVEFLLFFIRWSFQTTITSLKNRPDCYGHDHPSPNLTLSSVLCIFFYDNKTLYLARDPERTTTTPRLNNSTFFGATVCDQLTNTRLQCLGVCDPWLDPVSNFHKSTPLLFSLKYYFTKFYNPTTICWMLRYII